MSQNRRKNMGLAAKLSSVLLLLTIFSATVSSTSYTNLVYKSCEIQTFQDTTAKSNLESLLNSLASKSSHTKFYSATAGEGSTAVTGLYQCREDLPADECHICITDVSNFARKQCKDNTVGGFQFDGCHLRYSISGFRQAPETELRYKSCGNDIPDTGFSEKRGSAFTLMENSVKATNGTFYTGSDQSVYVTGQCQGDLAGDCGECLRRTGQVAETECWNSTSGQIYLNKCYINYEYKPSGFPSMKSAPDADQCGQKTVSIVFIALASFAVVVVAGLYCFVLCREEEFGV